MPTRSSTANLRRVFITWKINYVISNYLILYSKSYCIEQHNYIRMASWQHVASRMKNISWVTAMLHGNPLLTARKYNFIAGHRELGILKLSLGKIGHVFVSSQKAVIEMFSFKSNIQPMTNNI